MHHRLRIPKPHTDLLLRIPTHIFATSLFHTSNKAPEEPHSLEPQQLITKPQEEEEEEERSGAIFKISHPWPEWVGLMEHLLKKGCFEGGNGYPFGRQELGVKDTNQIRTALLNFARDRFDLIRYFSKNDISVIVGSGCPSLDRKVVNSGKRLRAHVGIEEGKVCSSCNLRGNCERAYIKAREDEGGRTVDVMRILLTYGLDPITGSIENTLCLNRMIKESVRRLLSEIVEFSTREIGPDSIQVVAYKRHPLPEDSFHQQKNEMDIPMKQGDWICPKCKFLNFAKNIKCLRCDGLFPERLRKLGEKQDHLPLKKGDWLCGTCNFLNFAKNTKCFQCKEKPPMRQLNPGEWECPSCNYINFKRNMLCLKCDWKRPKASNYSDAHVHNQVEYEYSKQPYGMNFVKDADGRDGRPPVRPDRRKESDRSWTSLQEDKDDDDNGFRPWDRFEDFPIAGGNSDMSQNPQWRERWKKEMAKRRNSVSQESEDNGIDYQLPSVFVESTDGEEMAGWFGHKN